MAATATKENDQQDAENLLRSKVNEITNLLPQPECTEANLREELGVLPGDFKKIRESGRVPEKSRGRQLYYSTFSVAREIVAQEIPWERTQLSRDREMLTFDEIFEYRTLYQSINIERETGVDIFNLAAAMDLSDARKINGHVAGGKLARALRICQDRGVRVFVSAERVREALKRLRSEPAPTVQETDPVDAAIAEHRDRLREESENREFRLQVEWGRLVQLRGDLSAEQTQRLGEIALALGYDGARYRRDVEILERVEYLESINSADFQRKTRKKMEACVAKRKDLERDQLDLPRKIQRAFTETNQARVLLNESMGAEAQIADLTNRHPHLFQDPADSDPGAET